MDYVDLEKIVWRRLPVTRSIRQYSLKKPIVTVDKESGRLSFNATVCNLFPEIFFYTNVEVLVGSTEQNECIGFRFFRGETTDNTLPLKKVKRSDDKVVGCYILSRELARRLNKTEKRSRQFELHKCSNSILAIYKAV